MEQRSVWRLRFVMWMRAALLASLLGGALVSALHSAESDDLVGQLKVAYLYNFTRFIEWPALPAGRAFVIGVIGAPEIAQGLHILEAERRLAAGRPIEIQVYETADKIDRCEVLFVGRAAGDELAAIVERTAGKPTLLVGDAPEHVGRGAAIAFFLKPDVFREKQRLRFRIDPRALHGRGLTVSAQLMDVAEVLE